MDEHTPPRESRGRTRRALLRAMAGATATATAGALAGCLGASTADEGQDPNTGRETTATPDPGSLASYGVPQTVCEEEIRSNPGIPAVVDPAFAADWSGIGAGTYGPLDAETPVVGIERAGVTRAYPVSVLTRHEVVNDTLGGPLLVTYCPLCDSGLVAERRVNGEPTTFHVTGLL